MWETREINHRKRIGKVSFMDFCGKLMRWGTSCSLHAYHTYTHLSRVHLDHGWGLIRFSRLDSGTVIVSSAVLQRPTWNMDLLTNANMLCISSLLTEDCHRNCPLSANVFHLQSPCLQMKMMLMIRGCIWPWTTVQRSFYRQLSEHMVHKTGKQICFIINSSRVGRAQGHKQPRAFWEGKQNRP